MPSPFVSNGAKFPASSKLKVIASVGLDHRLVLLQGKVLMAAPSGDDDDGFFVKLKKADPKVLEERQKAVNERVHATFEKSQQRLAELLDQNSTLPTTISSITVLGAPNTRRGFLERIFNPLLSVNRDRPYTQSEVLREVSIQAQKLSRFGM